MVAQGFRPHRGQQQFIDLLFSTDSKYYTLVSSRQAGKSMLGLNLLLYFAINDKSTKIAFVSPTYQQVRKVMEELNDAIADAKITTKVNFSNHEIHLLNGSIIYFRSAENYDALRGYTFDYMLVDEAAYIKEQGWRSAIQPTVLIKGKKVILMSTPRGRDFFYEMYQLGQSPDHPNYQSFKMTYDGNPFVDLTEIEAARKTLPPAIFKAEYEGEFIDGESQVFQNYTNCTFEQWPNPTGQVYLGVDLAQSNDYTCATAIDKNGNVVEIYRENQKDWSEMVDQIVKMAQKYKAQVLVESNSIGSPVIEMIRKKYVNIEGFTTTNKSKKEIIEGLILDFADETIAIPSVGLFEELHNELDVFEMKYSPKSRSVIYAAREPFHDDLIMSLAIANYYRKQNTGQYAVYGRR